MPFRYGFTARPYGESALSSRRRAHLVWGWDPRPGTHGCRLKLPRARLLRSTLTSLGIILGVAAVILMVSIGEGNKQAALRDIQKLGANNIIVRSQKPPESTSVGSQRRSFLSTYGLIDADLERITAFVPEANKIIPLKTIGSEISYGSNRNFECVSPGSNTWGSLLEVFESPWAWPPSMAIVLAYGCSQV